jgi:hypothetical protein
VIGLKALILVHKEVNKKTEEGCSSRTQGRSRFDINICSHIAMREIGKVKEIHCIKNVLWIHEHSTTDDTKNIFRNSK